MPQLRKEESKIPSLPTIKTRRYHNEDFHESFKDGQQPLTQRKKTINSYWVRLKPQKVPTLLQTTRRFRQMESFPAMKCGVKKEVEVVNLDGEADNSYFPFPFKKKADVNHAKFEKYKIYE
mmetsp:Transcript_19191/g.18850  ORF Transcript_19191/g.18850 Transcript_19191/m.18850 type:complete len:121 (-) Transcript_19191:25-387(-)